MRNLAFLVFSAAAVAGALASCYDRPKPNCAFLCGNGAACPEGYACGEDGRCHLVIQNGQLAACEDTLPVDGAVADAPGDAANDAAIDGPAADAFSNTPPTITLSPSATTYNLTAGETFSGITVSASDPDSSFQTIACSATFPSGSPHQNPFGANPNDNADSAGGTFDTGTCQFGFDPGILGNFAVRFSVSDGIASDSEDVVLTVSPHPLSINEVRVGGVGDAIELENTGTAPVDLNGWSVCSGNKCFAFSVSTPVAAGGLLVLHWSEAGTNDVDDVYTGDDDTAYPPLATARGEIALVHGATSPGLSRDLRDYLRWWDSTTGSAPTDWNGKAVYGGLWPASGDYVNSSTLDPGESLERTAAAKTPASWAVEPTPTIGGPNN